MNTTKRQKTEIFGLHAQTSIHAGAGQNTGVIDLPIQREGHNGWPCIFGSAVKGALRARAEQKCNYKKDAHGVIYIFGEDTTRGNELAGAIAVSDARLLLLPVRSLTSQFKWVTCPAAIKRFVLDAERFGTTIPMDMKQLTISEEEILVSGQDSSKQLFLEEYRFTPKPGNFDLLIKALRPLMNNVSREDLEAQLVIVNDDNFTHLANHTTPVTPHIAIDSKTKIVKQGALWYEETLAPETVLYVCISAVPSRTRQRREDTEISEEPKWDASQVLKVVTDLFDEENKWLQLGGNETVGMGWCAVSILSENTSAEEAAE